MAKVIAVDNKSDPFEVLMEVSKDLNMNPSKLMKIAITTYAYLYNEQSCGGQLYLERPATVGNPTKVVSKINLVENG